MISYRWPNFNSENNPYYSNTIHDSVQIGDKSLSVPFISSKNLNSNASNEFTT